MVSINMSHRNVGFIYGVKLYGVLDLSLSRLHGKLRNSSTSLRKQGGRPRCSVVVVGKYSFRNYVAGVKKSLFFFLLDSKGRQVRERRTLKV